MVDEFFDRGYQAARSDLNAALVTIVLTLGKAIANSFRVLNRIEYSAPWTAKSNSTPCN